MMGAEDIDASPVLSSGSVRATAKAVEEVLEPEITPEDQPLAEVRPMSKRSAPRK
jgi:hypothetical protein